MWAPAFLRFPVVVALAAVTLVAGPARPVLADRNAAYDRSTPVDELFARARRAVTDGRLAVAEGYYEEILRRDRTNLSAILELSTVYERTGRLEYARGLLIRATRIDRDYPALEERRRSIDAQLASALGAETDSLIALGDWDSAIPKLSLHNAIDPGNPSVHYKRAVCLFEMGRLDAALSDIDVAIAASPQEPYFLLRDRINRELKSGEIRKLESRARKLAQSDEPRHREQTLDLIAGILQLDPEHRWARDEFVRLTESEAPPPAPPAEAPSVLRDALTAAGMAALAVGRFAAAHMTALLILTAALVIFRSRLTAAVARRLTRPRELSGDLARFSVAEILATLCAGPRTGVLEIRSPSTRGRVYVEAGEPVHCTMGREEGVEPLMTLITKAGSGRFNFIEGPVPRKRTIDTPLDVLLDRREHGQKPRPGVPAAKKSRMKELLDSRIEV